MIEQHMRIKEGMVAAGQSAVEKARQTNTKLAIMWQGEVRLVTADEWDELAKTLNK